MAQAELFKNQSKILKKQKKIDKLKPGWNNDLITTMHLTQTVYHKWQSGGSDLFIWYVKGEGSFIFDTTSWNWANDANIVIGFSKQGSDDLRKITDQILWESVLTYKNKKYLNPYFSLDLRTQSGPSYDYGGDNRVMVSSFFDPAYIINGLGIGYNPQKTFRTRFGLATRTIVTRYFQNFAEGNAVKFDSGMQWSTFLEKRFNEIFLVKTRLQIFSSFDKIEDGNVSWDSNFEASITKYIIVNLQIYIILDANISPYTQTKEVLSVALKYKII
jgi:hypothetical protein